MENSLYKCYPKGNDVNKDHLADLVCRFYISKSGFLAGDTKAYVRFTDVNGSLYQGTALIKVTSHGSDEDKDDNADSN